MPHLTPELPKYNGNARHGVPAAIAVTTVSADSVKRKRALRKLLRDLVTFTGTAINDLEAAPRKTPQRKRQRLLYRRADTLSDDEVKSIVIVIGPERVLRVLDRVTAPELPLVAAE